MRHFLPEGFNAVDVVSLTRLPLGVVVAAACALAAAVALGFLATAGAPVKVRAGLLALRSGLALAIFALVLEPGIRLMATSREANRVIVAVDASASMAEDESGKTRAQRAADAALEVQRDLLSREQPFAPELWLFDDVWRRAAPDELARMSSGALKPEGKASKLALPLTSAATGEGEKPLGGVVIVSDGADT